MWFFRFLVWVFLLGFFLVSQGCFVAGFSRGFLFGFLRVVLLLGFLVVFLFGFFAGFFFGFIGVDFGWVSTCYVVVFHRGDFWWLSAVLVAFCRFFSFLRYSSWYPIIGSCRVSVPRTLSVSSESYSGSASSGQTPVQARDILPCTLIEQLSGLSIGHDPIRPSPCSIPAASRKASLIPRRASPIDMRASLSSALSTCS